MLLRSRLGAADVLAVVEPTGVGVTSPTDDARVENAFASMPAPPKTDDEKRAFWGDIAMVASMASLLLQLKG